MQTMFSLSCHFQGRSNDARWNIVSHDQFFGFARIDLKQQAGRQNTYVAHAIG
eukprot:SAG11_NODE_6729_length_1258_cov_1.512511_2_plen_53_part_00